MARWGVAFLICMLAAQEAEAAGSGFEPLAKALADVRVAKPINVEHDAGPELNAVKTALRLSAERRFKEFEPFIPVSDGMFRSATGLGAIERRLNADLKNADLTCDGGKGSPHRCGETQSSRRGPLQSSRGYVGGVSLQFLEHDRYLLLETSVGIGCGYDESTYVYEWRNKRWQLILASETDDYRENHYEPQEFIAVEVSPANVAWNEPTRRPPLILTLGFSPWCSSNWQALYARLWRASPTTVAPKALLDISPALFMGDEPAAGSIAPHDVLIQFEGNSVDGDVLVRTHLLHFGIDDSDRLGRLAPVALNPRDFVDEWLTRPWTESESWTDAGSQAAVQSWYRRFHAGDNDIFGEFDDAPTRCRANPTLWQVGFTNQAGPKHPEVSAYFLVRWMAPYRFTLVKIQATKFSGCDIKDAMPDNPSTLFPFPSSTR